MNSILLFIFITSIEAHLKNTTKMIYVGSAMMPDQLSKDPVYKKVAAEEFNCLTPGNAMKWDAVEGNRGHYQYGDADQMVKFANENGMKVRGHTLVWHSQLPGWVPGLEHNKTGLETAMVNHIKEEVGHYKGKIYAWDVVNEAIEDDGTLRNSLWSRTFNNTFITEAFKTAHSVDPNAKLYINDYNVEGKNKKSDALYKLVKEMRAQGVPIHGVGLQAHFIVGGVPGDMQANMQRFSDLGVDVAITELDVRIKLPTTQASLEQQAKDYAHVFSSCMAVRRCVGVTIWDFSDKYSWIPTFFKGYGAANMWDENFKPKPAVVAVEKLLH